MSKLSLCFIAMAMCIVGMVDARAAADSAQNPQRDIIVVKNIHDFVQNHPGLKLQRLTKFQKATAQAHSSQAVRYSLGSRITDDRLVAQGADVFSYPARKDVSIQLTYPETGSGSILTFIEISCTQDNDNGNAYIVAGGIGQRFISIVLEANQTENFAYQAQYYGVN